jgi:Lrp/AsnC family transcriptional regulator for asnA, asnC and gidA
LRNAASKDTMASVTRPASTSPDVRLDDVSKAIIEQLQVDGRQSYATIAKRVGLSEAAVRQRVQRLLDQEVM